jgi:hypothetical protein
MENCHEENCKYVLLGSSYISRLENEFGGDLKVPGKVLFMGRGGMKISTIPDDFLAAIREIQPACVFIHLDGNDITLTSSPKDIASKLLEIYDYLKKYSAKVFIGEIISRNPSQKHTPGLTRDEFDHQRKKINSYLKKKIGGNLVRFKDITFPNDYHSDGIHLSPQNDTCRRCGLEKYFFTIRRVLFSVKM